MGILSWLLATPVIAIGLLILTPGSSHRAVRLISALTGAVTLGISLYIYRHFDPAGPALQFDENILWIKALGIRYHVAATGLGVPLLLLTAIVIFCGVLSSWRGIQERVKEFHIFLMLLVTGVFGVFMAMDVFFFFVCYELAVLPMFVLIVIWGSTRKVYSSMKLTLYLLAGSALILVAIFALYVHTGMQTTDLIELKALLAANPPGTTFTAVVFALLFVGLGNLSGLWPFHTWSPDGHVAAPSAASMLHAGVLMKLGAYGILRIAVYLLPEGLRYWADVIVALAFVNILYGAFVAIAQTDMKFVIAYSSVSHMGMVMFGIGMMNEEGFLGASMQMFAHGVMTALFFSCVGAIYDQTHTRHIPSLGGLNQYMPKVIAFFLCGGLAGLGLPGFAGFVAEFLVFWGGFKAHPVVTSIAVIALVLTAYYVLRVFQRAFYGDPKSSKAVDWKHVQDADGVLNLSHSILVGTMLVYGICPRLFLDWAQPDVLAVLAEVTGK